MTNEIEIFFHVGAVNNYQEIFDEIYERIKKTKLLDKTSRVNVCVVGEKYLKVPDDEKTICLKNWDYSYGEFFTLKELMIRSELSKKNKNILYIHTKGVTTPNNNAIRDWRNYMTFFCIDMHHNALKELDQNDACGVDLNYIPAPHFSGNFWWANSNYIKTLPRIEEISKPDSPHIISVRHNAEFWIGMGNGRLKSLWDSGINVYERHLIRYPEYEYRK